MAMPVCVGCQKLQKQVGKMWTKMSCLESDVHWHAKKVAEIQAEAKALEAALCEQKNEASVTEDSESDNSSEEDAGGEMQEQLRKENNQLHEEVAEFKKKLLQKNQKAKETSKKPPLCAPTEAMRLQDPVAAEEITQLVTKIRDDERH